MKKKIIILSILILGSFVMVRESLAEKANEVQKETESTTANPGGKKTDNTPEDGTSKTTDDGETQEAAKDPEAAPKAEDTGTAPVTQTDDVSDGSKFKTYNGYESAVLAKKNPSSIYQLSQLYFKDGLYERAVNIAKKDVSGDIRNLFVVAIGSRLLGYYDQSIDYYNRILATSPNQAEAKLGIGIAYKAKGEFSKALGYLKDYVRSNPSQEVVREIAELNELISSK
jgi:putative tetratricopeptide repeat-containing domain protein